MLEKVRRKGNAPTLWVGMWTRAAPVQYSKTGPQKTEGGITAWPRNPTSGDNINSERYTHRSVHCDAIYNSQEAT